MIIESTNVKVLIIKILFEIFLTSKTFFVSLNSSHNAEFEQKFTKGDGKSLIIETFYNFNIFKSKSSITFNERIHCGILIYMVEELID